MISFNKYSVAVSPPDEDELSDDILLMRRIVAKDKEAFAAMLDLYMDNVFKFCYGMLQDKALAEDMTQEVFLKLWNNGESWLPKGRVRSWLLSIAHNLSIDEIRKRKPSVDIDDDVCELASDNESPEDNVNRRMVGENVKTALLALPERQREAIMLVYYSQCSNKEGANVMSLSVEAFESLLARAKGKLKAALEDVKEGF